MSSKLPAIALVLVCSYVTARSQGCCGMGSSLVAGGHPSLGRGTMLLQSTAGYAEALTPSRDRIDGGLSLSYGISERLSVTANSGFSWLHSTTLRPAVINKGTVLLPESTLHYNNSGLSDGSIGAQFSIIPLTALNKQELLAGLDISIPWGPDRKAQNGVELPENMQSGSGSYTFGAFASYSKLFPMYHIGVASTLAGRLRLKNRKGTDPGEEASALVSVLGGPFWITRPSLSLGYKTATASVGVGGVRLPATAGDRLDIIAGMELSFTPKLKAMLQADAPLWRDKYQSRFGNTMGLRASLFTFFPFARG